MGHHQSRGHGSPGAGGPVMPRTARTGSAISSHSHPVIRPQGLFAVAGRLLQQPFGRCVRADSCCRVIGVDTAATGHQRVSGGPLDRLQGAQVVLTRPAVASAVSPASSCTSTPLVVTRSASQRHRLTFTMTTGPARRPAAVSPAEAAGGNPRNPRAGVPARRVVPLPGQRHPLVNRV